MIKFLSQLKRKYNIQLDDLWRGVLYLKKYGYLDDLEVDEKSFRAAVKSFQTYFHLKKDGLLGPKSLHAMQVPRCAVPDTLAATSRRWNKTTLRYYIDGRVGGLTSAIQSQLIREAWASWAEHIDLHFIRTNNVKTANILIGVGRGSRYGFDGAGGTLAWAQLPSGNDAILRCRFDIDETWIKDPTQRGILFKNVAAHEFGHLLGLGHSDNSGALMAPFYNPNISGPQSNDDITRIKSAYEEEAKPEPSPAPSPGSKSQIITIKLDGIVKDIKVVDV